ncbi:MAG: glycosyltransferase family 2 protein, partial [Flavobacteriales bacterium]|nr:glycosyltransferase family 2 protein [Flavobacteriales bacterium]
MLQKVEISGSPELSVVMLVFNGEKYLRTAIESVLNQTFKNFEFIIINDGSTDQSLKIISTFEDIRIRVVNNDRNIGIPRSRNIGLHVARGRYLAWCDCDDINLPARFEKQISFLKSNPQYAVCGTWLKRFGGAKEYMATVSDDPEMIKAKLLFKTSILNPTSMWDMKQIREAGLFFDESLPISEDYDYYVRLSYVAPMSNIKEPLYLYR